MPDASSIREKDIHGWGKPPVNLPSPFTKALNIKEGDLVIITLNDSQMVIEKARKSRG